MKAGADCGRCVVAIGLGAVLLAIGGAGGYLVGRQRAAAGSDDGTIRAGVEAVLRVQEQAWNRRDIDAFVEHYWKSDALTFSAEGTTNRGFTATLNRYRERYPTPERMGRLSFDELEITPLGDSAALVLGRWDLKREGDPVGGNFSLVVRKLDDRWVIVHDHTSQKVTQKGAE